MNDIAAASTHEVFNQTPPLQDYNLLDGDAALRDGINREGAAWALDDIRAHGQRCGSAEVIEWGFLANAHKPEFSAHDRYGRRIDEVSYHPSYHSLMRLGLASGLHARPWLQPRAGAHVARAALTYMQTQVEAGHGCPLTMTFAAVPVLRAHPRLAELWLPKVLARDYDPGNLPWFDKPALTLGMGMTEKQGGSDVRANTTRAVAEGSSDGLDAYRLTGHKWFLSAPMSDGFLMLAQAKEGLTCFLVPRWQPDGQRNPLQVQRLKNKLGNVSNASSEVELRGALGWRIGDEGSGVRTIIEMVAMTRFDCMIGSSAGQRQAVAQAIHHAAHRNAFGRTLIEQPAMRNVLADLQLEVEGSLALSLRMARALDHSDDRHEQLLLRLGLPAGKYWICKRTPSHAYEAMECLGGNGVSEGFILARLYREAPINAIWEGSGNIQALDMLRAVQRSPEVLDAWFDEIEQCRGGDRCLDAALRQLKDEFSNSEYEQYLARYRVDRLALTMQAALLLRAGNSAVSDAFIASRLGNHGDRSWGTLPRACDAGAIIERGRPIVVGG